MKLENIVRSTLFLALFVFLSSRDVFSQESVPTSAPQGEAAVSTTAAGSENPELTKKLQVAADLFNKGDFNGALEEVKKICANEPKLAPPRIILANWFARAQVSDGVRVSLNWATIDTPNDPEAYLLLGEIALRQSDLAAASLFFERGGLLLRDFNADADRKKIMQTSLLRNLTGLAELRSDWGNMEKMIDQRIAFEGKSPELMRMKAVAVFRQKRDQDCLKLLNEADQLAANQENKGLPADAILSQLYLTRTDQKDARDLARKALAVALQKNPKSKDILALSAQMRLNDNDVAGARQMADQLLAEDPQSGAAKKLVATIALFQSDYATAEKLFQEISVASPLDMQAANGLALALCEQEDPVKMRRALEYAADNARKENRNGDFVATLGWVLFKTGDMQQAGQVLQQAAAVAQGNISPQTAYYLGRLAAQNQKNKEARELIEAALKSERPFAKKAEAQKFLAGLPKEEQE